MHLDGVRGKEETVPRIQDNNEIEKIPIVGSGPACPKILAVCGWCFWRGTSHEMTTSSHNPSRFMLGQRPAASAATATFACQHLPNPRKQPPEVNGDRRPRPPICPLETTTTSHQWQNSKCPGLMMMRTAHRIHINDGIYFCARISPHKTNAR